MTHGTALRRASSLAALTLASCASAQQVSSPFAARLPSALVPLVPAAPFTLRQRPARFNTSSSSCRRTARSITSFRAIRAPTPSRAARTRQGQTIQLQPVGLERDYIIDHSANAMFAACDGDRTLPGTDCRMNGFDQEASHGGPPNPEYVYVPHAESAPYFALANEFVLGRPHVPVASRRELRLASVHHRGASAQRGRLARRAIGAATAARPTRSRRSPSSAPTRPDANARASTTRRSATNSTTAELTWRFYTSTIDRRRRRSGPATRPSSTSATGPTGRRTSSRRRRSSSTTSPPAISRTSPGSRRSARTPTTSTAAANSGPHWVASARRTRSARASSGTRPRSSSMWDDWGGLYDHVPPPYEDYDGLGFRVPLIVISPTRRKTTSRTSSTSTAASCGSSRIPSDWDGSPPATRARTHRPRIASSSASAHAGTSRSRPPTASTSSSVSRSTAARLTTISSLVGRSRSGSDRQGEVDRRMG